MVSTVKGFVVTTKPAEFSEENDNDEQKVDIGTFDDTLTLTKSITRLVGIRLTREDSPFAKACWNAFYWFEIGNMILGGVLEAIYMAEVAKRGTFEAAVDIMRMLPCIGYLMMGTAKTYNTEYQRPVFENLVRELRGMWPSGRQRQVQGERGKVLQQGTQRLNKVVRGYFCASSILVGFFLLPPYFNVAKQILGYEYEQSLPFLFWLPFDVEACGMFHSVLVVQSWQCTVAVYFILSGDMLFCVLLSHLTMQFDLLAIRIKELTFAPSSGELGRSKLKSTEYSKDSTQVIGDRRWEEEYKKQLMEIIQRHQALLRLAADVEDMFSFSLLVTFVNSSFIICFCGFCAVIVEKWNEFQYKSFLATALLQTWILCWYGQKLLDSSEGVAYALYSSGWYRASKRIKSIIFIMIQRSQKQVRVTTFGFSVLSLSTYSHVLKTSWSYFTLLLNIYRD